VTDAADVTDLVDETEAIRLPVLDDVGRAALFSGARTANSFASTPVTDEELEAIWELAKWPPTAANTQPLRVLYVHSAAGRKRLLEHMYEGNRAKTASAPAVAVLAADLDFHEHIPAVFPMRPELKDHFAADDDARHVLARFNATLQAGYFLLAVRAVGLAAGPMGGFDAAGIDEDFFPGGRFRSLVVVNIGHPGADPWFDRLPRLGNDTALQWA
jgi:3-hydroxypropanoate dehydrogenase